MTSNISPALPATPLWQRLTVRHLTIAIEIVNLFVNGYLTYTKATNSNVTCLENAAFNCDAVTNSFYSTIGGIPVAYLGLGLHIVVVLLLLLEPRIAFLRTNGVLLIFGISLFGFAFHCYLTYASVVWIQSLCIWCLSAHTLTGLSLITTCIRLYRQFFTTPAANG
ncbi:MAG: vitamin K epoxide reductase family protein [Chloroflexota bacterium]|nr:vitamin K epoxide reductase family protein [Chloroflexota bacterium]